MAIWQEADTTQILSQSVADLQRIVGSAAGSTDEVIDTEERSRGVDVRDDRPGASLCAGSALTDLQFAYRHPASHRIPEPFREYGPVPSGLAVLLPGHNGTDPAELRILSAD